MQIYDSYLLKALDVKLPYSEEQPRVEWLLWRVSSQDDGETEHWNTSKVEEEDSCSKKKHHTQLTFNKSATTKNHKSLSSPLLLGRMEATCCQDEEPVFLRCGHQICVWVSKSHRCAGAGATPWWLRFPPLRRGSLQKRMTPFFIDYYWNWLLLSQEWRNERIALAIAAIVLTITNRCHSNDFWALDATILCCKRILSKQSSNERIPQVPLSQRRKPSHT